MPPKKKSPKTAAKERLTRTYTAHALKKTKRTEDQYQRAVSAASCCLSAAEIRGAIDKAKKAISAASGARSRKSSRRKR